VLVFAQLRRSTWDCRTVERYMVRRRSTVRFRKGAPQVRRVFLSTSPKTSSDPGRRSVVLLGSKSPGQSRCVVATRMWDSSSRAQDLDHSLSDRLFCPRSCTATIQRPVPLGGKLGGKIVKRRARGVVAASGRRPLVSVGQLGPMATALAFGVPACRWPLSLRSGPATITTEDRQGAGLEDLRHVDGVGALVDAEAGWRGADRLLACGSAASPGGDRVAS
jgi:hypothetical protein